MRKLILEEWLSLDGFAEDKNGKLDFFPSTESNRYSDLDQLKFLEGIGMILLGRKTYELFADFWPTATADQEIIADRLNEIPKIVFSNSLAAAPWGKWPAAKILPGDIVEHVKRLKRTETEDIVLWGSIRVAQVLMKADLIDEYHIQICPTLTGGGRPLFPETEMYRSMKLISSRQYDTGVVNLQYTRK